MEQFQEIFSALQQKATYPHPVKAITPIITAASVVFLTGDFAYKINKPVSFGFLDFSTLEKRKEQCEKEWHHNSLISPELYEKVVSVTEDSSEKITIDGPGKILEYGVKMKQMDPNSTMDQLLKKNAVTSLQVKELARKIFAFHQIASSSAEISTFGNVQSISFNWEENFSQTEKYIGEIISQEDFSFINERIRRFITENKRLLNSRIEKNKIKHCHGDFHSANVFMTNKEIYIFDALVFNQRFPCSDVIAEIAFMAMDLEFQGKQDLSEQFMAEYQQLSADEDIQALLPFYKSYRAYIRAKINCFTLDDKNLRDIERTEKREAAKKYFQLAKSYLG